MRVGRQLPWSLSAAAEFLQGKQKPILLIGSKLRARSMSLSLWQTKEGHRIGKHLEPQRGVGFLQRPEKPRMQFGRSPRGSPHFGQLEHFFMNRGICGIWQWLTQNLASLRCSALH